MPLVELNEAFEKTLRQSHRHNNTEVEQHMGETVEASVLLFIACKRTGHGLQQENCITDFGCLST